MICCYKFKAQGSMQNESPERNYLQRVTRLAGKFIDFPSAFAGAVIMGVLVGYINRKFGAWPASTAAMKQAVYTFLFGGMLTKLLYVLAGRIPGKFTSIIISALIVTIITVILVYAVHSLKGTPMPFESTLPTAILAPFGFSFLAYRRIKANKSQFNNH
jgi:hypothetical protein